MRLSKIVRYIVYLVFAVFVVSRMWVGFGEYQDQDYSALSTYATLALIAFSAILVFLRFPIFIWNGLNQIVLFFFISCMFSTFLYGNPNMALPKEIMYIAYWEFIVFLFFLITYGNNEALDECKILFTILAIPVTVLFLMSNNLRAGLVYRLTNMGNSMFFYLLALLPWLLMSKKQSIRLLFMLFILAMSVLSLKRSAMLACTLSAVVFFYIEYIKNRSHRTRNILLGLLALVIGFFVLEYVNDFGGGYAIERINNLEEDEGSGRLGRYESVMELISEEDDIGKTLFGHGYRTVEVRLGEFQSAHNDFLEVFYDYGILGFVFYLFLHIYLIRRCLYLRRRHSPLAEGYIISYIIFFVISMVSHFVILPTYFIIIAGYWGAVEGDIQSKRM